MEKAQVWSLFARGIAPALQVAHVMFESDWAGPVEQQKKHLHILWANRQKEDITSEIGTANPIVGYLNHLLTTRGRNVAVTYFTDGEKKYVNDASEWADLIFSCGYHYRADRQSA